MKRYSKQDLWALFLICAFPQHAWTIILALRDFSWVSERTNSWDAVGNVSYGLIYALIESVVIFLVALVLGFLISNKWKVEQRIVLLSSLVLITSLWAMGSYLYYMLQVQVSGETINFLVNLAHPLRFLYVISLAAAFITVAPPTFLILRSEKFMRAVQGFFDRLSMLTMFYLFFDFVGLIIVIIRNV